MDTESQWIYDRMRLYHLIITHPSWSTAQLAEAVGRSERWGRKWVQRFQAVETPTFTMFQSQSRAPRSRPRQIAERIRSGDKPRVVLRSVSG